MQDGCHSCIPRPMPELYVALTNACTDRATVGARTSVISSTASHMARASGQVRAAQRRTRASGAVERNTGEERIAALHPATKDNGKTICATVKGHGNELMASTRVSLKTINHTVLAPGHALIGLETTVGCGRVVSHVQVLLQSCLVSNVRKAGRKRARSRWRRKLTVGVVEALLTWRT